MLTDLDHLTGIKLDKWKFKWFKSDEYLPLNQETFEKIVPTTPDKYLESIEAFESYKVESKKLSDDINVIKKLSGII